MKNKRQMLSGLLSSFLITLSLSACSQDFEKISRIEAGEHKIKLGKEFNDRFYNTLKRGETFSFTTEATEQVKSQITPEMQTSIYNQVKGQFGDYEDSEFAEAWIQKSNPQYKILRYKGKFSASDTKLELRVVYDDSNKIAGFFIKPWSDMMN